MISYIRRELTASPHLLDCWWRRRRHMTGHRHASSWVWPGALRANSLHDCQRVIPEDTRTAVISHRHIFTFKYSVWTSSLIPQRSGKIPACGEGRSRSWSPLTVRLQSRSVINPECADTLLYCLMRDLHSLWSLTINGEHNYTSFKLTSWRWLFN